MPESDPLIRDGLSLPQLAMLVHELNLSGFITPADHIFVRLVVTDDRFSKLSSEIVNDRPVYEIKINLPGLILIANLARCLMGDHLDPATYIDSVLGATYAAFSDSKDIKLTEICSILERTRPETFRNIREMSNNWGGHFPNDAKSVRSKFYSAFSGSDVDDFCIEAAARFIVGHELGHYISKTNPQLANDIKDNISAEHFDELKSDTELFCDIIGILHVIFVQQIKREKIRPSLMVLGLIITFFDALMISGHAGTARKTMSTSRYRIFIEIAQQLYKDNQQIVLDLMDISVEYDSIIYPITLAVDDIFNILHKEIRNREYENPWRLSTADYPA